MISATVMAHPKRGEWAEALASELDCGVTWDEGWNDRHTTGLHALKAYDPDATHHLIVQDDAILARDFRAACEIVASHAGDHPVGLYVGTSGPINATLEHLLLQNREGLLATDGPHWGVAILLPVPHLEDLARWYEANDKVRNYDRRISRWYLKHKIDCYYTAPSLVDHRHKDNPSLVSGRGGGRRAAWFIGDRSALDVDFSTVLKGTPVATFRNYNTGQVVELGPDDTRFNRLNRMKDRWERLDPVVEPEPIAPAGIAHDVDMSANIPTILEAVDGNAAKAQAVMEAEATHDKPRKSLMSSLAEIVTSDEEE